MSQWIEEAQGALDSGLHEEAAKIARDRLQENAKDARALWILANTSPFPAERYIVLKRYTAMQGVPKLERAQQLLKKYENHPDVIAQQKNGTATHPKKKKNKEQNRGVSLVRRIDDYIGSPIPALPTFALSPVRYRPFRGFSRVNLIIFVVQLLVLLVIFVLWFVLLVLPRVILRAIRFTLLALSVIPRIILFILSPITFVIKKLSGERGKAAKATV